jgi:hypothetical protein
VRAEAAEPEDGEAAGGEEAEPKTHDPIVGSATSRPVQPK